MATNPRAKPTYWDDGETWTESGYCDAVARFRAKCPHRPHRCTRGSRGALGCRWRGSPWGWGLRGWAGGGGGAALPPWGSRNIRWEGARSNHSATPTVCEMGNFFCHIGDFFFLVILGIFFWWNWEFFSLKLGSFVFVKLGKFIFGLLIHHNEKNLFVLIA